jgi:hypothetical protein
VDGSALVFGTGSHNLILLDRRMTGYPFFGRRFLPSFRPTHLVLSRACTETQFAQEANELLPGESRYVPGTLRVLGFCPDDTGAMRFFESLGEIQPASGSGWGPGDEHPTRR